MSNKAFQSKVAVVPGGAELLVAAGYEYRSHLPGGGPGAPTVPAAAPAYDSSEKAAANEELFLVHSMDAAGRARLQYTLIRIQELLESVSGPNSPLASSSPRN